ncbi:unnamed protein product [Brassica rapa subsp. trilocularis]
MVAHEISKFSQTVRPGVCFSTLSFDNLILVHMKSKKLEIHI